MEILAEVGELAPPDIDVEVEAKSQSITKAEPRTNLGHVCVMGLGYIGLPTASMLANRGYSVAGVDVSSDVVNTINRGEIHIVEPDLDMMVRSAVNAGSLTASLKPEAADVFVIAVPTPFKSDKKPDLSYVLAATKMISEYLVPGNLVILESTSPPGTTDEVVAETLREHGHAVGTDVFVAHCPERVLPGKILIELIENDRVVGGVNEASANKAVDFYETFVRGDVIATTAKTAELVKLTENSSRDVQIAFANEISMICDQEKLNAWEVIELANKHPRVNILNPGPGVGGHCIAVDPWFIVDRAPACSNLIRTAREVNDAKPKWVVNRIRENAFKFKKATIACLGLSFKADVDDLRESPAFSIYKAIQAENLGEVIVCEPNLTSHTDVTLHSLEHCISQADIVVVLVDHKIFRKLSAEQLKEKVVIDTRGIVK